MISCPKNHKTNLEKNITNRTFQGQFSIFEGKVKAYQEGEVCGLCLQAEKDRKLVGVLPAKGYSILIC